MWAETASLGNPWAIETPEPAPWGSGTIGAKIILSTSTIHPSSTHGCLDRSVQPLKLKSLPSNSFFLILVFNPLLIPQYFGPIRKKRWPHYKKSCVPRHAAPHSPGSSSVLSRPHPPSAPALAMRRLATPRPRLISVWASWRAPSSRSSPCAGWVRTTRP